ncbi:Ldh family oxidoreductase [Candidatus Poribacteria bacterium]|nr:Ldh family oxidoreductase [Candidatus Poribacteria bacterium]MYK19948.1 Ldh family oxidoreductase [Candidatus Poribacteria bacterium]
MPNFTAAALTTICLNVFEKLNISKAEAEVVTRSMVDANRVGHDSHGVIHLSKYVRELEAGLIQPDAPTETLHESASIAVLDGNWGFGPVIATRAVELAVRKAKQTDISSVTVSRCNEVGRLGGYACLAADAEMIGLLMANDHGGGTCVAPHGGVEGRLSTNPMACAVPIEGQYPIVLDMSTSVVASGKIRVKQHRDEALPHGWLIDEEGESTTNPDDFYGVPPATLLPFGGAVSAHKGFGLSVLVDILSGALTGAGCSRSEDARVGNGLFVLVINVASFRDFPGFSAEIERFIAYLKSAKRVAGVDTIRVPGERGWTEQRRREREGIPIDAETWAQIQALLD